MTNFFYKLSTLDKLIVLWHLFFVFYYCFRGQYHDALTMLAVLFWIFIGISWKHRFMFIVTDFGHLAEIANKHIKALYEELLATQAKLADAQETARAKTLQYEAERDARLKLQLELRWGVKGDTQ